MDIGDNFRVASNLTVLSSITSGGAIYTKNISSSTINLNIYSKKNTQERHVPIKLRMLQTLLMKLRMEFM